MKQRIVNMGEIGLNTDVGPSLLPDNAITQAHNVFMIDGSARSAIGERKLFDLSLSLADMSSGSDTWANVDAIDPPGFWETWELNDVTGTPPTRPDGDPAEVGDVVYWDGGFWVNKGPIADAYLWIEPVYHTAYIDASQKQWVVVSDGLVVVAFDMEGISQIITPATPFTGGFISFANLNGVLVVNSASDGPFYWPGPNDPADPLVVLPGWDAGWLCQQMVTYKYFLVALGMEEALLEYPHKVRWSNSAEEGSLPTEWVIAADNDAGSDILGETPGRIMGGQLVRDKLFVIKEDGVYQMRWIGGDYIMDVSRLQGTIGTTAPRGWAELQGTLVIFTSTDLLVFDGQEQRSISDQRVRNGLFNTISEERWETSQLYYHAPSTTLYVAAAAAGYTQLSYAIIYNSTENTFGHKRLHYGYGFDTAYVSFSTGVPVWDELGEGGVFTEGVQPSWIVPGVWDDQNDGTWNKGRYQPSIPDILEYESNGLLSNDPNAQYWVSVMAQSNTDYNDAPKYCEISRIGIPVEGAHELAQVNEFWFELSGDADIEISVGGQLTPNGAVTWARNKDGGTTFSVNANEQQVVDPIITGMFMAWKIASQSNGHWRLHAITADWEPAGDH